jgi:sarcosine/dimethylglycine N-methyltransferase
MRFYREEAEAAGFRMVMQEDRIGDLRTHYSSVLEDLTANEQKLRDAGASVDDIAKMKRRPENWVRAMDAGYLSRGSQVFRKPA